MSSGETGKVAREAGQKGCKASKVAHSGQVRGELQPDCTGTLGCKLCLQAALAPGKIAGLWSPAVPTTGPGLLGTGWGGGVGSGHTSGFNRHRCWLLKVKHLGVGRHCTQKLVKSDPRGSGLGTDINSYSSVPKKTT